MTLQEQQIEGYLQQLWEKSDSEERVNKILFAVMTVHSMRDWEAIFCELLNATFFKENVGLLEKAKKELVEALRDLYLEVTI